MSVNGQSEEQPRSTSSMWQDMFGLGPLFRMVSDPMMQQNAVLMMQAVAAGASSSQRLEAKLDFIIRKLGHDPATIVPSVHELTAPGRSGPALIPDGRTGLGAGAAAASGLAADDGTEADQGIVAPGYFESGGF